MMHRTITFENSEKACTFVSPVYLKAPRQAVRNPIPAENIYISFTTNN